MARPLIGITMDSGERADRYALNCPYAAAVEKAGGLPVALPFRTEPSLAAELVDRLDGILFSGGDDLDPSFFGQELHPKARPIDPARQRFELALLAAAEARRRPILGICLGAQLLNVHRGGSLVQFLPDRPEATLEHRKLGRREVRHLVKLEPDTLLQRLLGKAEIMANSSHKQAIDRLGKDLRIIARAEDGVIEGVEDPGFPLFLGIQWHPERLQEEEDHLAVFKLLVAKAAGG